MTIAFITHNDCALHDMGQLHPECPSRLSAINDQLIASGLELMLQHFDAPLASREQLERVHNSRYVQSVFDASPAQGVVHFDADTTMNPHTLQAALRAAGAGVMAVDLIMQKKVNEAFCSVRPPGHHAERNRAMGFCFFNNIAVAAAHAIEAYGFEKLAIVDFDVHHGNGTEDIFAGNNKVLFCSSFQHPFYPYSGTCTSASNIVNVPLPANTDGASFRQAIEQYWLPALHNFKPELILCSAGFDAHIEDQMSLVNLVDEDYSWISQQLKKLANQYAEGRIISMLEGGYALSALGRCVVAHIKALLD